MTHAFMYGTAVFEGIRAYWNAEQGQLYALKVREHMERIRSSAKVLLMADLPSVDQLDGGGVEVLRRNGFREDAYVRPSFYKSTQAIGVKLHGLEHRYYILALPFGDYVDTDRRRQDRDRRPGGAPATRRSRSRAKIVGSYVNPAFSKSEAMLNGYDEALVLTEDGHISEGSAENIFVIRDGVLVTPPVTDDILEGITRAGIMEICARARPAGRRALDRPLGDLRRGRGVLLRHRRPDQPDHRGRPAAGRRRRGRARSRGRSRTATSTSSAATCRRTRTG